jgi:hypothetical protein
VQAVKELNAVHARQMVVQDKEDGLDLLSQLVRLEAMSRQDKMVGCFLCNRLHEKRANGLVVKVRSLEDARNPALEQLMKEAWKDGPLSIANLQRKKGKSG